MPRRWRALAAGTKTLAAYLKAHLNRLGAGDYCCISAYVEMHDTHQKPLQAMRQAVRDAKKVATCLGYGPRFLHSTGQAYKVVRTVVCFYRSPVTMLPTCQYRDASIPLASSRRRRFAATLKSWWSVTVGRSVYIWAATYRSGHFATGNQSGPDVNVFPFSGEGGSDNPKETRSCNSAWLA